MSQQLNQKAIPLRDFGKTNVKVSALGMGEHHLGAAQDVVTAIRMVEEASDGGITFFENCWEYLCGKAEDWLDWGLKGKRDRLFVASSLRTGAIQFSTAEQVPV
jgi:uncharacterized protein